MEKFHFAVHQKVKLVFNRDNRESSYSSSIQDLGTDTISVLLPQEQRAYLLVPRDEQVRVIVFSDSGMYYFFSREHEVRLQQVGLLIFRKPQTVYRIQRRRQPRVRVGMGARFVVLSAPDSAGRIDAHAVEQSQVYDLCEQGMCLIAHVPVSAGTRLEIRVQMPDPSAGALTAVGTVVRVRKDPYLPRFFVAVAIEQITADDQRFLCRYIEARLQSPR